MAAKFGKRLGFQRQTTAQELLTINHAPAGDTDSLDKDQGTKVTSRETELEANAQLKELQRKHRWDPNLPNSVLDDIDHATHDHDLSGELNLVDALTENSPYPEVRAAVRPVSLCMQEGSGKAMSRSFTCAYLFY